MALIEVEDVSFRYVTANRKSIRQMSYAFAESRLYCIIGANGAGKTTLCNLIRGFVPKFYEGTFKGKVTLRGENIDKWNLGELGLEVGLVFQNPFTQITGVRDTVFEEIAFSLENLGVAPETIRKRTDETIARLGIQDLRDRSPIELSGGERQRVAIASIVVMEPNVIIMDEPTSQLDPQGTEEVFRIIRALRDEGKTLILVEHKMDMVSEYADEILVLDDGRLILSGTPAEVFKDPLCDVRQVPVPTVTRIALDLLGERRGGAWQPPVTFAEGIEFIRREVSQ